MRRRIAIRAIILDDGELLGVRLKPTEQAPNNGSFWCIPGGGLESGEGLLEGLKRELIEETGIEPEIGNLLYVQQFQDGQNEHLEFFFHVTNYGDYMAVDLTKTSHGAQEIQEIGFVDPKTTAILPAFLTERQLAEDAQKGMTHYFSYL